MKNHEQLTVTPEQAVQVCKAYDALLYGDTKLQAVELTGLPYDTVNAIAKAIDADDISTFAGMESRKVHVQINTSGADGTYTRTHLYGIEYTIVK